MCAQAPEPGSPEDWLSHAVSDLDVSRTRPSPAVLFETLCFHAQQAAEKAIKAVLISRGIPFPRTHDLRELIGMLPADIEQPSALSEAHVLTYYAVLTRYPGGVERLTPEQHRSAVQCAEGVVRWAQSLTRRT